MQIDYFAYGSNLCLDQMVARTGADAASLHPRIAFLADHRLVFQRITRLGSAYANIVAPGSGVAGVTYRCTPEQLERLDRFESGYERQPINVTGQDQRIVSVVTYVMRPGAMSHYGQPSAEYLERIVTGAQRQGLTAEYIGQIVTIATCKSS
jgi:gamma-glutamylcyclotransferase